LQKLTSYADRGDASKVKSLASKGEATFQEFADAFKAAPSTGADADGNCFGWAAKDSTGKLEPCKFTRRELRPDDVRMQVTYCGMCHSDVHQIYDEWGGSIFPMVPGHEVVGVIVDTGKDVKKFKVGDFAAVGCMVDSCGECERCKVSDEQYCSKGMTATYNAKCAPARLHLI
jgi:D-arabinose 1-dehydrogenase-like Zn-dependent alcohol dehydrogenase